MNYVEQIEHYLKYYVPKYFMSGRSSSNGFDINIGKHVVDSRTFLMYIGSRIVTLKANGVETNELINLWSTACQQVISSAYRNIEVAKVFCSKDKHAFSQELHSTWDEVLRRELKINNAKSIRELDEKDLLNKTYTQFLINISSAIKNCELFPLNDHARTELELLKKECKNQLQDKYNSGEPTIELLTEDELFYQCQERKSYHDYLDCYPFGVYSKKAKRARDMKENILVTILWIVLICFGGFMFYLFFIRGDWRQTLILMGAVFFASMLISLRKKLFRI